MPPCQKVLMNKIKRTQSVTRMIKSSKQNTIDVPEAVDGYYLDESNKFGIEYFSGYPYPQDISDLMSESTKHDDYIEDEFDCHFSSSDEEYEETIESCDWN